MHASLQPSCSYAVSVELLLELLLKLLVLVSHDVQKMEFAINNNFDFVRWPLHFEFPSYTSVITVS